MRKTIFKGWHRPIQIPAFLCPIGKLNAVDSKSIEKTFEFTDSCRYTLSKDKQADWNKLFGLCFGIMGIHQNSVRFGWRYNISKDKIEICTIVYKDGVPYRIPMYKVDINEKIDLKISVSRGVDDIEVYFFINDVYVDLIWLHPESFWYFGCGLYFGGTSKAPHKIKVNVWKKK